MADPRFNILGYLNPFNRKRGVKALAWLSSRYLGAHELNVSQEIQRDAIGRIGKAALGEGAMVSGGLAIKGEIAEGLVTFNMSEAEIFLLGSVHDIDPAAVALPAAGTHAIGIRLTSFTLDHTADATLKGIAPGTRAEGEPMAHAYIQIGVWGWEGDGQEGDFFPIYTVNGGDLVREAAGSQNDAYTNQIRLYDRERNGHYIVDGCGVHALGLTETGEQAYSIDAGTVNVYGYKVKRPTSSRLAVVEAPDIELIQNEPHALTGQGPFTVLLRYAPLAVTTGIPPVTISITRQRVVTMTHGAYSGVSDALPDATALKIVSVKSGDVTYVEGVDFTLNGASIDWSLKKAEPSPGATYQVVYQYQFTGEPDAFDDTSVTITDAVSGSLAQLTYRYKMPRWDAIVIDRDGVISLVKGISSRLAPQKCLVTGPVMKLADVWNIWGKTPQIIQSGTKKITVEEERNNENRLSNLEISVAELRLKNAISSRDPVTKRGLFADPLLDDTYRDQGTPQTAAVFGGAMVLPIAATSAFLDVPALALPFDDDIIVEQGFATMAMKINPYQVFPAPVPMATLDPAVDIWSEIETIWSSDVTRRFYESVTVSGRRSADHPWLATTSITDTMTVSSQFLGSYTIAAETIRERDVGFQLTNFGPGETLLSVTFDGITINL